MALTVDLILAKARGFTISIEKMGKEDRSQTPTGAFADDYNKLLAATAELLPDLAPILPPAVRKTETASGTFAESSYREIDAFCEQIYQLASECEDPE